MGGLQPILIKWVDISTISGWTDIEDLDQTLRDDDADMFYTIGFLIEDNKDFVRVAHNICVDKDNNVTRYADITTIRKTPIEYIKYK